MQVGDLVKFYKGFENWVGIITEEIPGTSEVKVVHWSGAPYGEEKSSHPKEHLVLVKEYNRKEDE